MAQYRNNLFIQFYENNGAYAVLTNGFSDTLNLCKSMGDVIWMDEYNYDELPFKKGNVYISSCYTYHIYRAYVWAKQYPDINFVVGGPGYSPYMEIKEGLPKNLKFTVKSVEEWFDIPNFSRNWDIDLPEIKGGVYGDEDIKPLLHFNYTIDNFCRWSKCNFCSFCKTNNRERTKFDFEFEDLDYSGSRIVRLGTSSFSPDHMKLVKEMPFGFNYETYIRSEPKTLKSLIENYDDIMAKNIKFTIGLEYPTERMWKYMKKGYKKDTTIETINLIKDRLYLSFIIGWNNLTEKDLFELEDFMNCLPDGSGSGIFVYDLHAVAGTEIHETYEKEKEMSFGPFYTGFWPKLSKKQKELSERSKEIITSCGRGKKFSVTYMDRNFLQNTVYDKPMEAIENV